MVVGSIPKLIMCKNILMRKDEGRRVKERRHVRNLSLIIKEKKRREENKKTFPNVHRYVDATPTSQASTYLSHSQENT